MKLAEVNHQIRGVSQRLKQTYARLHRELYREAGEAGAATEETREVRRLLRRKAELRLIQARTLAAHPGLVDLLAERKVARLRVKWLRGFVSQSASVGGRPAPFSGPLGELTGQQLRFRLMAQTRRRQRQRQQAGWVQRRATLTGGQLRDRLAAAEGQLSRVSLEIERLSWETETVG